MENQWQFTVVNCQKTCYIKKGKQNTEKTGDRYGF